jgi:hypothetical protein
MRNSTRLEGTTPAPRLPNRALCLDRATHRVDPAIAGAAAASIVKIAGDGLRVEF